jgi:hypothetical protein
MVIQNIKLVRNSRKHKIIDKVIIKLFKGVFLRWCDRHLSYANDSLFINSAQLHLLDAQMKGDIGCPGYPTP